MLFKGCFCSGAASAALGAHHNAGVVRCVRSSSGALADAHQRRIARELLALAAPNESAMRPHIVGRSCARRARAYVVSRMPAITAAPLRAVPVSHLYDTLERLHSTHFVVTQSSDCPCRRKPV